MAHGLLESGGCVGEWSSPSGEGRLVCQLCPRECSLKPGDRGFCFVRENRDGQMVLNTYGRSTGFCIDPIEKKPLNHFYPGTSVLSFGTAGCNLGCKFCQNWDISKSREIAKLSQFASPSAIAAAAAEHQCHSVAFTYNDPVIWAEYAIDTAIECHSRDIRTVAVTAGYISSKPREAFFAHMDATNVDLKSFSESFYHKITYSHLDPVLQTLKYIHHETQVWMEITNLVIPGENDSTDELTKMCDWIVENLSVDVPVHFSGFHPDFRMLDRPATPVETLIRAYDIARKAGLRFVYVGNVHDPERQSTYCPNCNALVVERDWYAIGRHQLVNGQCGKCGQVLPGRFNDSIGTWGRKRLPIVIQDKTPALISRKITEQPNARANETTADLPIVTKPLRNQEPTVSNSSETPEATIQMLDIDHLSDPQKHQILEAASRFVVASVLSEPITKDMVDGLGDMARQPVMGAFVTLKRSDQLRGCCGMIGQPVPLADALYQSGKRTATDDRRFPPISRIELSHLKMDVTLLGETERLEGPAESFASQIEVGKHGLRIGLGQNFGLLLPSVAEDNHWTPEQFLIGVCRKAGLPENAWQSTEAVIERFEGVQIDGQIDPSYLSTKRIEDVPMLTAENVLHYRGFMAQNITALMEGSTPSYYMPQLPDGTVNGIVLSLIDTDKKTTLAHLIRVSLRPGMALQATLFEMAQSAAQILASARLQRSIKMELALTILHDSALHGQIRMAKPTHQNDEEALKLPIEGCDLAGVDTKKRAIVAMMSGERITVAFEGNRTPEQLVHTAIDSLSAHGRPVAIYSMQYLSTRPYLTASSTPAPQVGPGVRTPAFAGSFYAAADSEREEQVAGLMLGPAVSKTKALAIMTPHAGLKYSGRVAADVWRRVNVPKDIIIIGPKHTPNGVDWAVAPHRKWKLSPKIEFTCNQNLARMIAESVDGMQLDATAHAREHGTEVQLPFIEAVAPESSFVSIAMHGGTWVEIQQAAKQLADCLKSLKELPLLVISSDMNHYAPKAENKRRDRLALAAMKTCDPKQLLTVCEKEQVSMCGALPAALIMQTLIELGKEFECEEVNYATSADHGGDPNRVVGYAGVILKEKS